MAPSDGLATGTQLQAQNARYATEVKEEYVDVVNAPGAANNGQSIGYATQPAGPTLQKMKVVTKFDNARFFEFYVDLLTRPVPIR